MILLGFSDPLRLIVWAFRNAIPSLSQCPDEAKRELVLIRDNWRHPNLDKWATAKASIAKARRLAEQGGFRMTRAEIEAVKSHWAVEWYMGDKDELVVYHCLNGNPGYTLIEGINTVVPGPGSLWLMGGGPALRCVANHGDTEALSLVLTLKRETEE